MGCSAEPGTQDFIPSRGSKAKRHYTIQVGGLDDGAGPAVGGVLGISFQFFADRDDDNVFDPLDDCPDEPGVREAGGCPPELRSTPKLTAAPTATGIIVKKLSVSATKGAKVEVRCRRALLGPPGAHGRGRVLPAAARARAAGRRRASRSS